ncbi:MAG: capsular biosynthesis protein [Bacteroidales bacterium]|nr:capsular biosynthesis protein [Bacteroidales bacterium]
MFFLTKKFTLADSGIFDGLTDWHSHVLPGVDDGLKNAQESYAILDHYEELGVRELWLTPHIMEDVPNDPESLKHNFEEFKGAYAGGIQLNLAAENMIDNLFESRLKERNLLPLGGKGKSLLVETSYYNPPMGLQRVLAQIKIDGLTPVLAHPERYRYMAIPDYEHLKSTGVLFQLNMPSLIGAYGKTAKEKAEEFMKRGWYEFVGFDLHSYSSLKRYLECKLPAKFIEKIKLINEGSKNLI